MPAGRVVVCTEVAGGGGWHKRPQAFMIQALDRSKLLSTQLVADFHIGPLTGRCPTGLIKASIAPKAAILGSIRPLLTPELGCSIRYIQSNSNTQLH